MVFARKEVLKFDKFVMDFDFKIKMKKQSATNNIKKIF